MPDLAAHSRHDLETNLGGKKEDAVGQPVIRPTASMPNSRVEQVAERTIWISVCLAPVGLFIYRLAHLIHT